MDSVVGVVRVGKGGSKSLDAVSEGQQDFDLVNKHVYSVVQNNGGHIHGRNENDIYFTLPVDAIDKIRDIFEIATQHVKVPTYIGVGETLPQAIKATDFAQNMGKSQIKVYHGSMDQEQKEDNLGDVLPVATSEGDSAAGSELYKTVDKDKLRQSVAVLAQNKDTLNQLQQSSPETYQGIVQALLATAHIVEQQAGHEKTADKQSEKVQDAAEKHLDKEKLRQIEAITQKIQEMEDERNASRRASFDKHRDNVREEKRKRLIEAKKFAQKTGHHSPKFLANLAHSLKKD